MFLPETINDTAPPRPASVRDPLLCTVRDPLGLCEHLQGALKGGMQDGQRLSWAAVPSGDGGLGGQFPLPSPLSETLQWRTPTFLRGSAAPPQHTQRWKQVLGHTCTHTHVCVYPAAGLETTPTSTNAQQHVVHPHDTALL